MPRESESNIVQVEQLAPVIIDGEKCAIARITFEVPVESPGGLIGGLKRWWCKSPAEVRTVEVIRRDEHTKDIGSGCVHRSVSWMYLSSSCDCGSIVHRALEASLWTARVAMARKDAAASKDESAEDKRVRLHPKPEWMANTSEMQSAHAGLMQSALELYAEADYVWDNGDNARLVLSLSPDKAKSVDEDKDPV